jgi:hypothetical protein
MSGLPTFAAYWEVRSRHFGHFGPHFPPVEVIARDAFRFGLQHSYERDLKSERPLRDRPVLNPPVTHPLLLEALATFAKPRPLADGPVMYRWKQRGYQETFVTVEQACELARDRIEELERMVGVLLAAQKEPTA